MHPTVYATPSTAHALQIEAEKIAQELRDQFDLNE
jgi:hypothetical protein